MGCFKPSCCGPPEPGLSRRQCRKALRSPARRTGFPAVGHENIPSHCPCSYHKESLCSAGDNVNSYPGNRGKQLGLFGILHGAAACLPCEQGPAGPGRRRFSGAITNLPHRPLAGHRGGKSVAAQGKNLYLRQTNVVAEGCGVVCGVGDFTPASSPEAQGPVLTLKGQAAAMAGQRWVPGLAAWLGRALGCILGQRQAWCWQGRVCYQSPGPRKQRVGTGGCVATPPLPPGSPSEASMGWPTDTGFMWVHPQCPSRGLKADSGG